VVRPSAAGLRRSVGSAAEARLGHP